MGPCDLYHKIWLIFVLFFYILLLFPLLLSLQCWEALWPETLNTFILCYTSPSLFVMEGVREICVRDRAWNEKQPIAISVWMRSCRQNSTLWKAVSFWNPTRLSILQTTCFLGKGKFGCLSWHVSGWLRFRCCVRTRWTLSQVQQAKEVLGWAEELFGAWVMVEMSLPEHWGPGQDCEIAVCLEIAPLLWITALLGWLLESLFFGPNTSTTTSWGNLS